MGDPYQNVDGQSETTLEAMATRLEERGAHPLFQNMIHDYLSTIPQDQALSIMELGCGTGVVTRQIREHVTDSAQVVGLDLSEKLLSKAQSLAPEANIRWLKNTAESLPVADHSQDIVVMHTLMSHVPKPVALLQQAARTLKSGGRLIIFDADYASTTYGYPDFERMRRIDLKLLQGLVTQMDLCRQLPRYLKQAGLCLVDHKSYLVSEAGRGDYWLSSVKSFAKLIPALKILPEAEGQDWVKHMLDSHEQGTFFAAGCYYTYFAKPSSE